VKPGTPRNLLVASALGALVLGIGGRVLMRIIALANGSPGGFSVAGSLEVVAAGALFGALGGLILLVIDRARLYRRRALILAAALFLIIGLASDAARGAASRIPAPGRWLALGAFAGLLLLYSMLLLRLARRTSSDSGSR
jgi:membrane associated rhomboid family serine protease